MPIGGLLVSQVSCPSLRLSSPRPQSTSTAPNSQQQEFDNKQQQHPPGSQLSTTGIRQQTAAAPTSQQQHSKSTRVYITAGNCVANPASPRAPLASQRLVYGSNWSQTDRLYRHNLIKREKRKKREAYLVPGAVYASTQQTTNQRYGRLSCA